MNTVVFNEERSSYYKAKKREIQRKNEASLVIQEDAQFIHYYGMSAYLELFPEAKEMGISWHREVLAELKRMERNRLGQQLSGYSMAYAANKSKKARRSFIRIIKDLTKR